MRRHQPDRPALERWLAVVDGGGPVDEGSKGLPGGAFDPHRAIRGQGGSRAPKKKTPTHEILRYLCQKNGMSGAGLGRLLEVDRTLATRILRGERNLTVSHIQKTCKRFKLSAERFIYR